MEFKRNRELKRTRIEIIPMIDTVFFMLIFFVLSSLAFTRLNGLPVNLPHARMAPKQAAIDLTITVDRNRRIYIDKEPVTPSEIGTKLLEKAGGPDTDFAKTTVVINADLNVPHGLVVTCMDEARAIGMTHFAIATAPDETTR